MKKLVLKLIKKYNFLSSILFNYDMYKYLNHQNWIFKLFQIRTIEINFLDSKEDKEDVSLVETIKKDYLKDIDEYDISEASDLWKDDVATFSKKQISDYFKNENPKFLSNKLNGIFRTKFVYGLSSGDAYKLCKSYLSKKIWSLKYLDLIISLNEYYATLRHESPAQGKQGIYLNSNLNEMIINIEKNFKANISFPNIGSPYGIKIENKLLTFENLEHIYAAEKISKYIDLFGEKKENLNILEIGSGYGGLARNIFLKMPHKINSYTLVDLPLMLAYQKYFLKKSFQNSELSKKFNFKNPKKFIYDKNHYDVLINQNSFAEMNKEITSNYLDNFIKKTKNGLVLSFNHEAISTYKNNLQVALPDVTKNNDKLQLLLRSLSWIRKGYVEEVYLTKNQKL
jgi:putative sugar O-methyltransferase